MNDLKLNTILHYRIIEQIGQGGMGIVYRAEDLKVDRIVALKFLPQSLNLNENRKRFFEEAKSAAALNHPNICAIYDINELEGECFIVMEFIEGKTLRECIGKLLEKQIIEIVIQIAIGLSVAHEKGIIHRDIKPENIILNNEEHIKIMDFGLAKRKGIVKLTQSSSTILGTLPYSSPENIKGFESDARTDIWSLGVLLYELLTGTFPFKAEYDAALMYSIMNIEPDLSEEKFTNKGLIQLIEGLLQKDREKRIQTAREVIQALLTIKDKGKINLSTKEINSPNPALVIQDIEN